ncbi:heat-inducible transcriptional repressor HrcA [Ilyobacter polytropus]|uniref:Heat-inducible transcription repressor HrcA n=1 Tax=Ilyobacter polytropus (strain ATCC 51220 / DSM 2926 / LMG 16218 / CuHBu1) TaxID=572544 RepID=E3HA45_ILYPC|nr:heat-inducible transcriptional repressor HrcA [Ilyobacter polytropus]ADO83450.1 heat-inducible transcription repressor HrcA [Ilyobacter polytropus DSM 2926]
MAISDREKLVLGVIIDYYLTFGDTIGSRTLVKKYNIELSSATIRNVMADLEDMGYISKTHTSSGRIPTDKGYKFYLHELLKVEKISKEERKKIDMAYELRVSELEDILKKTSTLLSKLTSYAGIVVEPDIKREGIKKVELVHIEDYLIMAVIVMDNMAVRTKKISLEHGLSREEVAAVSKELNEKLRKGELKSYEVEDFILEKDNPVLSNLENEVFQDIEGQFYMNNASSIFQNKSVEEARETLELFNKKKGMKEIFEILVKSREHDYGDVNVVFGDELNIKGLEDFSFVYSVYKMGESQGVIGVIGPRRMAYSKTMGLVKYVTKEVNKVIEEIEHKKER